MRDTGMTHRGLAAMVHCPPGGRTKKLLNLASQPRSDPIRLGETAGLPPHISLSCGKHAKEPRVSPSVAIISATSRIKQASQSGRA